MNVREKTEEIEEMTLSPYASLAKNSLGRDVCEEQCTLRTVYQRDRDRILHCKSFRRLKHKTQVFLAPMGDHYRTRLTHTLEVSQISRTISRSLRLNEDLTEAIALGHDLGHTPFGHSGERVLNRLTGGGFRHNEQSLRVVRKLENNGRGLNLTKEVQDGILNHRTGCSTITLEGKVVQLSDKIAYINHDIDDAIRAGIISDNDLPSDLVEILGNSTRTRLDTLIRDVVDNSTGQSSIKMSDTIRDAMMDMRKYMFENVYRNEKVNDEEEKVEMMIQVLFDYLLKNPEKLPEEFKWELKEGEPLDRVICDYIANMSDQYSVKVFESIFVPKLGKL